MIRTYFFACLIPLTCACDDAGGDETANTLQDLDFDAEQAVCEESQTPPYVDVDLSCTIEGLVDVAFSMDRFECREARDTCLANREQIVSARCAREGIGRYGRCAASIDEFRACQAARAEILQLLVGQVSCDDIDGSFRLLRDAGFDLEEQIEATPACQVLEASCPADPDEEPLE